MDEIFKILDELCVKYEKFEHEAVKTCAESTALLPADLPGIRTKHLFLHDRKKQNYFVVVIDENKLVDLKKLSDLLDVKSLGMASEEELKDYLNVDSGALSMLTFLPLKDSKVRFLIDEAIWSAEAFDCHPNIGNIVLLIYRNDWLKIFDYMDTKSEVIFVPEKRL